MTNQSYRCEIRVLIEDQAPLICFDQTLSVKHNQQDQSCYLSAPLTILQHADWHMELSLHYYGLTQTMSTCLVLEENLSSTNRRTERSWWQRLLGLQTAATPFAAAGVSYTLKGSGEGIEFVTSLPDGYCGDIEVRVFASDHPYWESTLALVDASNLYYFPSLPLVASVIESAQPAAANAQSANNAATKADVAVV